MEKITPCECPLVGFCSRHNINKNAHYHHLCSTNQKYFDMWERCSGPGQEFITCAENSKTREPVVYPETKPPCNCGKNIVNIPKEVKVEEPQQFPSLWEQAKGFGSALTEHALNGFKKTPEDLQKERLAICAECPLLNKEQGRCTKCGCFVQIKTKMESSKCPDGRW